MRSLFTFLVLVLLSVQAFANGKITGKITDEKSGEGVIGATIALKGTSLGTVTDVDGNFTLSAPAATYTVEIKYIGYQGKEVSDVKVDDNVETPINVTIADAANTQLQEVVVKSTLKKENISAMITYQKNTNTVAQVVSAEAIRRSPDRNTGEVLKRVSAASIQEGKYLVIRGLADRYNQAMLNGTLLSSTEPDRKTFSFDLFPSGMIDNIIINKAATPDLPGEFAGGLVQVNTKDIPSFNFFSALVGTGVNTQTVGKDFYYYDGGSLDILGMDDGTRDLPDAVPDRLVFANLNQAQRVELARSFKNDWAYSKKSAPLNANFQFAGGLNSKVFGKNLGFIAAINYNKQNRRQEFTRSFFNQSGITQKTLDYKDDVYSEDVLWGALANITMELNNNNRISLKNLFNVNGNDALLLRSGRDNDFGADVRAYQMAFKSTNYYTSQLIGSHYLPKAKLKVDWNGSYVRLHQDQPNLRRMEYRKSDGDSIYRANVPGYVPTLKSASKFYSTLTDNIMLGSADLTKTLRFFGNTQTLKGGYMMQRKSRDFTSRPFGFVGGNEALQTLPNSEIFSSSNMMEGGFSINELALKDYDYSANSMLNAGYLMMDNTLGKYFRLVWGARYELFNQQLDGFQSNKAVNVNTTVGDILPSVNLTYKLRETQNIRFSASQTVVRPEFRELSPFAFFDFELLAAIQGNPELQRTKIANLDLRYELYPRAGELITAGVFYKQFKNTIEQSFNESGVNTLAFNYINAEKAYSFGVEAEFRKKLDFITPVLEPFTAFANASYIYNEVQFSNSNIKRPMQGQSPYVINAGLQWENETSGTNATFLYNMVGRRIFLVGSEQNPNIWEAPRPVLDFQIAQKVFKRNGEFKLSVSDILNRPTNFYQDKDDNGKYEANGADFLRISRLSGTGISLSFNYTIK